MIKYRIYFAEDKGFKMTSWRPMRHKFAENEYGYLQFNTKEEAETAMKNRITKFGTRYKYKVEGVEFNDN